MAAVTSVGIVNGVPTSGTGEVMTLDVIAAKLDTYITALQIIDNMVLSAGSALIGKTDVQFAGTVPDTGSGTGGSKTQRMLIDSSQLDPVVAHGAADSGSPYKQGFKATTSISAQTMVSTAQRTDGFAGVDGVQITRPHCNLEDIVTGVATCTTGANTSGIAALGAGLKFYLCAVLISNTGGTTAGNLSITDGTGGTEKANVPFSTVGAVENLPLPVPFSANTAVFVDPSGSDTIKVTLIGFKSKV